MKTKTKQTPNINYTVPDTTEFEREYFNCIVHKINDNQHDEKLIARFGSYSIEFEFAHDENEVVTKNRVLRGGIDKKLTSISNLKSKTKGISNLKRSNKDKNKVIEILDFFRSELQELKVNRRNPVYYTGTIKHKATRDLLQNSAVMVVEQEEDSLLVFVVVGNVRYRFETKRGGDFSDKQLSAHSRFTAHNNDERTVDWYEEDESLLDDFEDDYEIQTKKQHDAETNQRTAVKKQLELCFKTEAIVQVSEKESQAITNEIEGSLSQEERYKRNRSLGFNDELDDLINEIDLDDL